MIERVAFWPEKAQEEALEALLSIEARHSPKYVVSKQEREAVLEGLAEADRGEFVSDVDMAAFFKRHGL